MSLPVPAATPSAPSAFARWAADFTRRDYQMILVQLALLWVVIWQFDIEKSRMLAAGLGVMIAGFGVHALLPDRLRLPFFLLVSLVSLDLVTGHWNALFITAVSLGLIGIAILPINFWLRAGLLVLVTAMLFWKRQGSLEPFWAVLGSMFMFRMISFMFNVKDWKGPLPIGKTLAYFFMAPNAFYQLFPVVDFQTFCDSYFKGPRREIYQTGVHWLVMGVAQLLLFRVIQFELIPSPIEVKSYRGVALFLAMNYGGYLRTSGQFHIICGMLHLFGFNMPRTHDNYFLASSYSDIWRRINIYWKDFLAKTFFYPAFFLLRKIGAWGAVFLAVVWVFIGTWFAHSWQTFWLRGEFPLEKIDGVLWIGVGALVALNSVWDYYTTAQGWRGKKAFSIAGAVWHSLKIVFVFSSVAVFWSIWSNLRTFKLLMFTASETKPTWTDAAVIFGVVLGFVMLSVLVQYLRFHYRGLKETGNFVAAMVGKGKLKFDQAVGVHLVPMVVLLVIGNSLFYRHMGTKFAVFVQNLREERVTHGDAMAIIDGYYEQLNAVSLQASPFLGDGRKPPESRFAGQFLSMTEGRTDILEHQLIPGFQDEFEEAVTTVNRWGMRDKPREPLKEPGTYRIAAVGSSVIMGFGVNDDETITRRLEDLLNRDLGRDGRKYEVLNFAVGRYFAIHRRALIEKKVFGFRPDIILYFSHQDEIFHTVDWLNSAVLRGVDLEDPCLQELVDRIGVKRSNKFEKNEVILHRHLREILQCTYARILEITKARGVPIVYVYLPIPGNHDIPVSPLVAVQLAKDAGFPVIDLTDWWGDRLLNEVVGATDRFHPRPLGTQMIAERLEKELLRHPVYLGLDRSIPVERQTSPP